MTRLEKAKNLCIVAFCDHPSSGDEHVPDMSQIRFVSVLRSKCCLGKSDDRTRKSLP